MHFLIKRSDGYFIGWHSKDYYWCWQKEPTLISMEELPFVASHLLIGDQEYTIIPKE